MKYLDFQTEVNRIKDNRLSIVIFGAGMIGNTWAYELLNAFNLKVNYYCDNNPHATLFPAKNVEIITLKDIDEKKDLKRSVFFISVNKKIQQRQIKEQLLEKGILKTNIFVLDYHFMQLFVDDIIKLDDNKLIERFSFMIDDETFLEESYGFFSKKKYILEQSQTFNEKIQWLKINDYKDSYIQYVDKDLAKQKIREIIGERYIIPTYGVYDNWNDILFDDLPEQFVIKCTHDSGSVVICKDKKKFNYTKAKESICLCMDSNIYWAGREKVYKTLKPKIIIEKYLCNADDQGLDDYKIWIFNGKVEYIQYIEGREIGAATEAFFDSNWVKQTFCYHNPLMEKCIDKPEKLDEMLDLAAQIANVIGAPFLRIDFYCPEEGNVYFGEVTFYPMGGFEKWKPETTDYMLGNKLKLKIKD